MIPEGWSIEKLNDLATIERGKFSARPRNEPKFYGGDHPFVQTGDVSSAAVYLREHSQTLNDAGLAVSKMFPPNTILMTIAANIGDVALTVYPVACPDSVVGIIEKKGRADAKWLMNVLQLQKEGLDRAAPKLAQKNINLGVLRPLPLLTPPLSEQRKIAEILSTWDQAIETTERLLANARTQKRALMQTLLTGKHRFPEFEGQEWKEVRLEEIMRGKRVKGKIVPTNDCGMGIPYIGATSFDGNFSAYTDAENAVLCGPSELLVLWDGENAGAAAVGLCGAVSSTVVRFRFKTEITLASFVCAVIKMCNYRIRSVREGSGIPHMPKDFAHWFRLLLPPLAEQEKIMSAIDAAQAEISALAQQAEKLRTEKKALMQQLLTGKRRVVV